MNKEDEVSLFLKRFKDKAKIFGIVFRDDRGKKYSSPIGLGNYSPQTSRNHQEPRS